MTAKLDPITLELIHSKVTSIIEEMRIVLFHSGYSTVLRESEDGSAGLLDARLRTVAVSKKLPLHFGSFAAVADHLARILPRWTIWKTAMSSSSTIPTPAT